MKQLPMGLIAVLCVLALAGCVTPPRGDYVPTSEPGISSTAPRPHDVRLAVTEIVDSMFNEWDFASQAAGKMPYIAFSGIENQTPYNWNQDEIVGWIEESVVRTGKATFSNATDPNRRGGRSGQLYRQIDFQDPDNEYVDQSTAVKKGGIGTLGRWARISARSTTTQAGPLSSRTPTGDRSSAKAVAS